ncbi:hypothetical protein DL96DRAFT_1269531 [Flagelloscypha sp. PMI_526]|nr:hypothetical protein DL96DRAFT_1269531 [Flagelloscypha sp. PMI_526]
MLTYILDEERHFVPFNASDEVLLFVNHMSGLSVQELYGVVDENLTQLRKVGIVLARVFSGTFFGFPQCHWIFAQSTQPLTRR